MSDGTMPEEQRGQTGGAPGTSLAQRSASASKVRRPSQTLPARMGATWATVSVVGREYETSPNVTCKDCGHSFSGGLQRIEDHIIKKCKCSTPELQALKKKIIEKRQEQKKRTDQKEAARQVQRNAEASLPAVPRTEVKQRSIEAAMATGQSEDMDSKIAEFVYGDCLSTMIVESPRFKAMIECAKTAPLSYKLPTRQNVGGKLLDDTVVRLRAEEVPLRETCVKHGCTVVSDGWDDVEKTHLINFLVATQKGAFFDGTFKLSSGDAEDAQAVATLMAKQIRHVGELTVVQVVTDTCSVMKAAWKILEKEFPWITCTCCAPHVLSLLLKDIAKIPAVKGVLEKVRKVLNRFWGRKRWCRNKLREVVQKNHGKKLGLYRAAPTRFAGHVREMGRMLRLKAELKYIVDLPEYGKQDFRKKRGADDADGDDDTDGEGGVRAILLDEAGFWAPLVDSLKVMTPVVKLLRLCDGEKPAMGKVYDRMFLLQERVKKMSVSWAKDAARIIASRWEYLHSDMHAAGYAFDPEFIENVKDWDTAVSSGVLEVIERLCLREAIHENKEAHENPREIITTESEVVVELVAECERQLAVFKEREGIFTKPNVVLNAKKLAPAQWWGNYGGHLPLLSRVATTVLAQVVSAYDSSFLLSVCPPLPTQACLLCAHIDVVLQQ